MDKKEKIDLIILLIFPIIASLISLLFRLNAFISVIIFLVVPGAFLSFRVPKYIKKSLIFSAVTSLPIIIVLDYVAHVNLQWVIPSSVCPFRLFGLVTLEVMMWAFFLTYYMIMFYECFLDKHVTKKLWNTKMKYLAILLLSILSIFVFVFFSFPYLLKIPYFYLIFGIFLILIPILIELFRHPNLSSKFFKAGAYFFYMSFIYEVTALKLGWWFFPGTEFIGWIKVFGVSFPFEELFFWLMLLAIACLSYYEFFDDDEK